MINLTLANLEVGSIIEYKGETLGLIEPTEPATTFLEETEEKDEGEYVDGDAPVYMKQRWLVEILPKTVFDKKFRTHRYIEAYYSTYRFHLQEQERRYGTIDSEYIGATNANELGDDFSKVF